MKDKILYFPHINLPNTDWTVRTLLYYDQVGTIVPNDHFYNPEKYGNSSLPYMITISLIVIKSTTF
jgi:hypothetical protein